MTLKNTNLDSITLNDVSYQHNNINIINKISNTITMVNSLAITGSNGSGKTTLLKLIAGILAPTQGTISLTLAQKTISSNNRMHSIGFVGDCLIPYMELSASENIQFIKTNELTNPDVLLTLFNLFNDKHKLTKQYSSGMLQRLKIILALINNPPILLLDEPGLSLDQAGKKLLYNYINKIRKQKIIVIATNDEYEAKTCSKELKLD